jgi:hypothetical protein
MESMSGRIEIEKLIGSNFELWKINIEDMLVDHDLWAAISIAKPT